MSKLYKINIVLKDGRVFNENQIDISQTTIGIKFILDYLENNKNAELTIQSTGEKFKSSEIEKIEIYL